ncbi:hypothetical protein [Chondromyces apiculatus]|uniref:Uncharacterized protein n=1 Tax=Chondromyces apiculatus DSM 436 TaxID=1192034 RepID=A0A017SVH0_9BACT|nr:hypothetical protein [Chondromyces apiculatus]EYF00306.1 Hypothetical protein CAP_0958 [Chondromyces apiculatus DSM 436]
MPTLSVPRTLSARRALGALVFALVFPTGCGGDDPASTSSGSATSSTSTGNGGSGGDDGMGSHGGAGGAGVGGSGGSGGTGGAGGGGVSLCIPGETRSCYSGPPGTENVGACASGTETCGADGSAWEPCVGEVLPTPETCDTDLDDDCDGATACGTGDHVWSRRFSCTMSDGADALAVSSTGDLVLAGTADATIDFGGGALPGNGSRDVYVATFSPTGASLMSARFGDGANQIANGVAVSSDGSIVLTGYFTGTLNFGGADLTSSTDSALFIAKLDANGGHLWSHAYGQDSGGSHLGHAVAVDADDNVIVVGANGGTLDFGTGPLPTAQYSDIFVVKLDLAGNVLWARGFPDTGVASADDVAVTADGSLVITGEHSAPVDFGGGPLPAGSYPSAFLAKLDPAGNHVWSKSFAGGGSSKAFSVAVDAADNVALTGTFSGSVDFGAGPLTTASLFQPGIFVAAFDPLGTATWSLGTGSMLYNQGNSIAADGEGNWLVTGTHAGGVDFGLGELPFVNATRTDFFVAKLDPSGNAVWSKGFHSVFNDQGAAVATGAADEVYVSALASEAIDLGGGPLPSACSSNGIVLFQLSE